MREWLHRGVCECCGMNGENFSARNVAIFHSVISKTSVCGLLNIITSAEIHKEKCRSVVHVVCVDVDAKYSHKINSKLKWCQQTWNHDLDQTLSPAWQAKLHNCIKYTSHHGSGAELLLDSIIWRRFQWVAAPQIEIDDYKMVRLLIFAHFHNFALNTRREKSGGILQ